MPMINDQQRPTLPFQTAQHLLQRCFPFFIQPQERFIENEQRFFRGQHQRQRGKSFPAPAPAA